MGERYIQHVKTIIMMLLLAIFFSVEKSSKCGLLSKNSLKVNKEHVINVGISSENVVDQSYASEYWDSDCNY